jgi:hypothetical protein
MQDKQFTFEQLHAWTEARSLTRQIYCISTMLPGAPQQRFDLYFT